MSGATDLVPAPLVYVDTNVFITGFESPIEAAKPVQDFLLRLRERPGSAVTSELTLAELLAPVSRPGGLPTPVKRRLYLDLLIWSKMFDLRPITRDILIETADLRRAARHTLPDAIHLVTAIRAQCRYFLSYDNGVRPPQGMERIPPDRPGIDVVLRAWTQ
jgi:predicted nucleic acid-binding protein